MSDIASRLVWLILMTFFVAIVYGLFLTTMDFMRPNYSPVVSGHHAATNVYDLFGSVSNEIKHDEALSSSKATSIAYKIARPYAVTADLSAFLTGKLEIKLSALFRHTEKQLST